MYEHQYWIEVAVAKEQSPNSISTPLTAALVRLYLTCGDFFRILDSKGAGAHTCNFRDIKAAYQAVTALIEGSDHE